MASEAKTTLRDGPVSPRRGGFSLAEILIATAILGVGLVMVVGVFPAAIEQNKDSTQDVIGTMIIENAMGIAKVKLTHPLVGAGNMLDPAQLLLGANPSPDTSYPTGDANYLRGFVMMARLAADSSRNDYQFAVVAYVKTDKNNRVGAATATLFADANDTDKSLTIAPGANLKDWLKMGSPVIDPSTGAYAMIVGVDTGPTNPIVYLNHSLGVKVLKGKSPIVIAETDSTNKPLGNVLASPATCVLITRTALRQK